ncbi:MAG TPA: NAD(P)/FAD-dependent oxidoreductase [Pseudolysinimonas sp.]|nr:NAD(P)/FAD-dependent oxidoreductase [Pseudolysinimonas sp.]
MPKSHVIIIGGGFAGLIAARELTHRGFSVVLLEGRDRLGGRTWTDERLGLTVDLGGKSIHPSQPYVWPELERYGLSTVTAEVEPERFLVATADGPREIDPGTVFMKLTQANEALSADAQFIVPRPFDPWFVDAVAGADGQSVGDRVAALDLDEVSKALLEGQLGTAYQSPLGEISFAHTLHFWSLAYGNFAVQQEASASFGIKGGTRALIDAIAADTTASIVLGTKVVEVQTVGDGVVVRTASGDEYEASAVIVTAPINALPSITFEPALSSGKRAAITKGTASNGAKIWVRTKGEVVPFLGFASPDVSPVTIAEPYGVVDGDSIIDIFVPDVTKIDPHDRAAVEQALRLWVPDIEVRAVDAHNWVEDEFSRETWPNPRVGDVTGAIPALRKPEGRVFLAGADYAAGWYGHIDGAVESGIVTARIVRDLLSEGSR